MTYKELVELAAAKIRAAKELLMQYPEGELPLEVESQVRQLLGEYHDAEEKAKKLNVHQDLRQQVTTGYEHYHGGTGAPRTVVRPDQATGEWKSVGEWLLAAYIADKTGKIDPRLQAMENLLLPEELKALSGDIGAGGGWLIPPGFMAQFMMIGGERAIVRPRAMVFPMATRSIPIPSLDQTTLPTGGSAFHGGVVMHWIEESEEKPELDVGFKQVEVTVHEVAGWLPVPNALLSDTAISLEALLPALFGNAITDEEDYQFLTGNGVAKPMGVLNSDATEWVNRDTASDFKFVDVVAMEEKLLPGVNAIWVLANTLKSKVYMMQDAANRYLWVPNFSQGVPSTLMGRPIIWTEKLPSVGTKGDALLAAFSYYVIGDRERPSIATSIHERFRKNQTTWRISARLDGQTWLSAGIPLRDGSSKVSPFVGLDVP